MSSCGGQSLAKACFMRRRFNWTPLKANLDEIERICIREVYVQGVIRN